MKCFRHDPGKVCPECGLDRTMVLPPPNTEAEKRFEIKLLKEIKNLIEADMPIQEILNVLERARHIVTKMIVEASGKQ